MAIPRNRLFLLAVALAATPAAACLPPPPGWVPPTEEEQVRWVADKAPEIVYGIVTRGQRRDGVTAKFRILHVYRGSLKAGAVIDAEHGWGLDPPMCIGMIARPPIRKGEYGMVYFFPHLPQLNYLSTAQIERLFALGAIERARR